MKLSHLATPEFKQAVQKLMSMQLPIKTTFKLKKSIAALESELKIFEETREDLVKNYGQRDESGNLKFNENSMIQLDLSRAAEWQPKFTELMSLETSTEFPKFKIEDFGESLQLSANDLFALGELIEE
jgi:hypothetical protein